MNHDEYEQMFNDVMNDDTLSTCQQEVAMNEVTRYYKEHKESE